MARSFLAVLAGLVLVFSATGCGGSKPDKSEVPENPIPPPGKNAFQPANQGTGPGLKKGALDPNAK